MIESTSLAIPKEIYESQPNDINTKKNTSFSNKTYKSVMKSASTIKNVSILNYNLDNNQTTPHFLNTSSFVIKRSTDDFYDDLQADNQSLNRSKSKDSVNFDRLGNLNYIDRIDIDNKKLNNSKHFMLPSHKTTTKLNSVNIVKTKNNNFIFNETIKNDDASSGKRPNSIMKNNSSRSSDTSKDIYNNYENKNIKKIKRIYQHTSQGISRKNIVICVILALCVAVAVGINFINLSSDYADLMDFYRGFMGRRLLIVEGRLTSKSHIQLCKAKEQIRLELGPQVI